jgi:hypothetical protein
LAAVSPDERIWPCQSPEGDCVPELSLLPINHASCHLLREGIAVTANLAGAGVAAISDICFLAILIALHGGACLTTSFTWDHETSNHTFQARYIPSYAPNLQQWLL